MCTLGHNVLSKMLVKCRNGTEICRGIRGVYKTVGRAGERWSDVARFVVTTAQSSRCQGNTNPAQDWRNYLYRDPTHITDSYGTRHCDVLSDRAR